jgi:hypothetical protein
MPAIGWFTLSGSPGSALPPDYYPVSCWNEAALEKRKNNLPKMRFGGGRNPKFWLFAVRAGPPPPRPALTPPALCSLKMTAALTV